MPRAHGPKSETRLRGQTAPRGAPPAAIADGRREQRSAGDVAAHASHTYRSSDDERRRPERDLHDGVQNEIVALIVKHQHAAEDRDTPPELAGTLSGLAARAEAALDAVREIAHGIYRSALAAFGVERALRARVRPASMEVSVLGTRPRGTDDAEVAAYFPCSEAIENVAEHTGRAAPATLRLNHDRRILAVCIQDDGRGFDPAHTEERTGLRSIRERIETLGGTVELNSNPGRGTVLTPFAAMATAIAVGRSTEQPRPTPPGTSGIVMSVAAAVGERAPTRLTETPIAGRLALGFKLGIRSQRERRRDARRLRLDGPADRDRDDGRPGERDPRHQVGRVELWCDCLRPVPARGSPLPPGVSETGEMPRAPPEREESCHPFWAMLTRRGRRRSKGRLGAGCA